MTIKHDGTAPSENPSNKSNIILSLRRVIPFIITFTISIILSIIYSNTNIKKQNELFVTKLDLINKQQTKILATNKEALDSTEQNFNKQILNISKDIKSSLQESRYQSNDWMLLKARYYLELASINNHWSNQTSNTLALLQEADQILATIESTNIIELRQIISKEQTILKQIIPIDTVGILSKLTAVDHMLGELVHKKSIPFVIDNHNASDQVKLNNWHDILRASLKKLETLIVIRHQDDESFVQQLTPAYVSIITETIHLNIQEAQWAILDQNEIVYKLMLSQIIEKINRIFDIKDPQVILNLKQIKELQSLSLTKSKPIIGESLRSLNNLINLKPTGESL